jgi:hypothetical protein
VTERFVEIPRPKRPYSPEEDKPVFPRGVPDDWFLTLKRRALEGDRDAAVTLERFWKKQNEAAEEEAERENKEAWHGWRNR